MSSDSIMLDSPTQTPTPKSHLHPPPSSSATLPSDVAMIIDDNSNNNNTTGAPAAANGPAAANQSSWDTKKYREELSIARSRLQHQHFDIAKFRDPLNKPLVTGPPDLGPDVQERMRKLFQECVSR